MEGIGDAMGMSPSAMGSQQEEVVVGLTARLLIHAEPNKRQSNPLETAVWNSHHQVGGHHDELSCRAYGISM